MSRKKGKAFLLISHASDVTSHGAIDDSADLPSDDAGTLAEVVRLLGNPTDVRTEHDVAANVFSGNGVIDQVESGWWRGREILLFAE